MTAVSVIGPDGSTAGKTVELPEEIFAAKVNVPLIHQVVVAQQAHQPAFVVFPQRRHQARRIGVSRHRAR